MVVLAFTVLPASISAQRARAYGMMQTLATL
jgi:hypothetical protein